MKRILVLTAALAAVLGAATAAAAAPAPDPDPVIDLKGVNHDKYVRDLGECRALAETAVPTAPPPATKTGKLKAGVAGVAKAGAHAVSENGLNVVKGAGSFAKDVSGQSAAERRHGIVINCLKGRGYKVLE
ncbi:MAG: hypothetical protein WCI21_04875 [Alphaproteobacteria bacterium]